MTKQEFIRSVSAMLAAGGTTESIDALEAMYSVAATDIWLANLVFVNDVTVGFTASPPRDNPVEIEMKNGDDVLYRFAMNERATFRWVASPCGAWAVSVEKFKWKVLAQRVPLHPDEISGTVRWIGSDLAWRNAPFNNFGLVR